VLRDPRHPYTVGLLRCIPRSGRRKDLGRLDTIPGFLPAIGEYLEGCVFADRCALAEEICRTDEPPLYEISGGHVSRCHFHERAQELPRDTAARPEWQLRVDRPGTPLLNVRDLAKIFVPPRHQIHALGGGS